MRPTDRPAAAKKIGNRPQARPSLRLLTSPACEHDESALSRNEVSLKISPVLSASWWAPPSVAVWLAASWWAWPRVSLTNKRGEAEAESGVGEAEEERFGA